MAKMEGAAAPIHGDLLCGRIPTESQARVDFATFLALMYARTPAMRRMSAEAHGRGLQIMSYAHASDDTVFESTIKRLEKERGEPIDGEMKERLRQAMLDPSDYVMEVPKEYTLSALNLADSLAPVFFKMKWTIVLAAQGFFVTSGQSHCPAGRPTDISSDLWESRILQQDGGGDISPIAEDAAPYVLERGRT